MANVKITDLTELFSNTLAGTDVLPIVDIDADETLKISIQSLREGVAYANDYVTYSVLSSNIDTVSSNVTLLTNNLASFSAYANVTFTTNTHIDTKIAELVDGAPGVLDTLNEIAEALGDDPNFSNTISNSITDVETRRSDNTFYQYNEANVEMSANLVSNASSNIGSESKRWDTAYVDILHLGAFEVQQTQTSNVTVLPTAVFSRDKNLFNSAKLVVNIEDLTYGQFQSSEILLVQDTNKVNITEYAIVHTSTNPIATFEADFSGNDVRLLVTASSSDNLITVLQFIN